ncbi:MAG: twin-arginine translocase TatA/TatE family subunit [Deltaproteobacteria bacterium]|nr:twin-arginine translocase TatA/TatE family subunit [Deltaproteobacteria bacterium]
MFGIGMPELLIILGLALILIGPKKLPQLAKSLGKTMGELRKATDDIKETISKEIDPIRNEIPNRRELEEAVKKKFLEGEEEEKESKAGKGPQTK